MQLLLLGHRRRVGFLRGAVGEGHAVRDAAADRLAKHVGKRLRNVDIRVETVRTNSLSRVWSRSPNAPRMSSSRLLKCLVSKGRHL